MHETPRRYHLFECDGVATLAPSPYAEELYGDATPEWMCECQRYEAAMDV